MSSLDFDTDVIVIGSGPTGGTAALALATYGVRVTVATYWNWTANTPRAHITNQRTMEVLRDLGIEDEARKYATPWESMGDTLFTTSFAGEEIARLRTWGTGDERLGDYLQGSPCPMADIPQTHLEPVILTEAAARGARMLFNTEYLSHVQDAEGVTVVLRDRMTDREYALRAKYLIGADGARSKIVEQIGLKIEGQLARAGTVYTLFDADLARYVEHRPSILYWIVTSGALFGEIGMGLLRAIKPWNQWISGWGFDMTKGEPDMSPESVMAKIRAMVGDPNLELSIRSTSVWYVNQAYATTYSVGRVFCGGDAVHRHPPSSGLGSNTCIQDAFNLAWKLAFVLRGEAGPGLLDSYSLERAPVGRQIVMRANQSRVDYAPLNKCFRVVGDEDPVAAGLKRLRNPGPEGAAVREEMVKALELKNTEFNAQGVELNQRYESAAVTPEADAAPEVWQRDRELYLQASTRPGAKLPHVWLVDHRGKRVSTLDVVGKGHMTLVTGLSGQSWVKAAARTGPPSLRVVVIGSADAQDLYCAWARHREVAEAGALLVRPDGYVAWRHVEAEWDDATAHDKLSTALSAVLSIAQDNATRDTNEPVCAS